MNIGDLVPYLSGGSSNSNEANSIGGSISLTAVRTQTTLDSFMSGVTMIRAVGNDINNQDARLSYNATTDEMTWRGDTTDSFGTAVSVTANGFYQINSGTTGFVVILVDYANLPVSSTDSDVTLVDANNMLIDDVSPTESSLGDAEYRCFYLRNKNQTSSMTNVKVWVDTDAIGADSIEIGLGAAGKNASETAIADESTAPASVTFSAPGAYSTGLSIGTLNAGDYYPVWIKRTVPTGNQTATLNDYFAIGFGAEIV